MSTNTLTNKIDDPEFKAFIEKNLRRAGLNSRSIKKYTDKDGMSIFATAFMHKSLVEDAAGNYEFLEIIGDGIINSIITRYITEIRFPGMINVHWINTLKSDWISKRKLSLIAQNQGFPFYISYSDEYEEKLKNPRIRDSLYEDTMEAFVGAVAKVIDQKEGVVGPGYGIAFLIIKSYLDEITDISLDPKQVFHPIMRLKELYDKRKYLGWDFPKEIIVTRPYVPEGTPPLHNVKIYAYVWGDKSKSSANRKLIGEATADTLDKAKREAAEHALSYLENIGIKWVGTNAFTRKN